MAGAVLSGFALGALELSCAKAEQDWAGADPPMVTLPAFVVRMLVRQARYGTAMATINAKPFRQLSAAGKKAANARWDRARAAARIKAAAGDPCEDA